MIKQRQRNDILMLIEDGKKNQADAGQGNIKYLNLSNVLSESDKTSQSLIYPDQQNEQIPQFQGDNNSIASHTSKIFPIAFVNC